MRIMQRVYQGEQFKEMSVDFGFGRSMQVKS